eukprot:3634127-Amphidinium_carterae.1
MRKLTCQARCAARARGLSQRHQGLSQPKNQGAKLNWCYSYTTTCGMFGEPPGQLPDFFELWM